MAEVTSTPQPTAYSSNPRAYLRKFHFTVEIDSDCIPTFETMAQAEGLSLADWVSRNANQALRTMFGF